MGRHEKKERRHFEGGKRKGWLCVTSDDLVGSSYGVRVQVLSAWPRFRHAVREGRFGNENSFSDCWVKRRRRESKEP